MFQEKELRAKEEAEATQSLSTISTNVSRDASCLPCFALFPSPTYFHILSTRRQQLWCSGRTELHSALVLFLVSASPFCSHNVLVLIVLLLPVRYSSSVSFKFLEAFSFLRQHPLGKRAGRVLSQGLKETSRNFLFLSRSRK